MNKLSIINGFALAAALFTAPAGAALIDTMDSTDFFSAPFGAASVTDNLDGTVTLSKAAGANIDSGIVWGGPGGAKIDLANSAVTITPAVLGEDFINVVAEYFDALDNLVNTSLVVTDTNTDTPINFDVAADAGIGAVSYTLQIRILPFDAESATYTFDSIQAVPIPEPASLAMVAMGAACLLRRRTRS